jgi:hypothetical protein
LLTASGCFWAPGLKNTLIADWADDGVTAEQQAADDADTALKSLTLSMRSERAPRYWDELLVFCSSASGRFHGARGFLWQ